MKPRTFANMVECLEDIIAEENEDRDGTVYQSLAEDMAKAAALVYDACLKGQSYAESETEVTTG
jgi:hypothetical protein